MLVVAPSQRGGAGRLTVASLAAPGVRPGLAVSSWTRHSGVVSIVDIGPTILDQLGHRAAGADGGPSDHVRSHRMAAGRLASSWLIDANKGAQFRDREISQVTVWFVVLQIVLTALALVAFVRFGRRAQIAIELAALALLGFLAATFLAGLLPFYRLGAGPYWLFLFGVGAAIALISWLTTDRSGVTTLIVALGILVGLIIVDVATGARLQFNTVFGYSPTVAGRFAGLGNLGYAQLAAGAVLLAGLARVPDRWPPRRAGRDRAAGRRDHRRRRTVLRQRRRRRAVDGARVRGHRDAAARLASALEARRVVRRARRSRVLAVFAAIDMSRPVEQAHAPRRD